MLLLAIKPNILFPLLHPTTWSEQARYMPSRQHSRLEPILSLPPSQSKARLADVSLTFIGDLQQCFPSSNGYGWLSGHFSIAVEKTSLYSCKEDLLFQKNSRFPVILLKLGPIVGPDVTTPGRGVERARRCRCATIARKNRAVLSFIFKGGESRERDGRGRKITPA